MSTNSNQDEEPMNVSPGTNRSDVLFRTINDVLQFSRIYDMLHGNVDAVNGILDIDSDVGVNIYGG